MPDKVDFIKVKVQAIKDVLEKTSAKERENRVSIHMASEFNSVLKEIAESYPDVAPQLSKPIQLSTSFHRVGQTNVSYVDLMIMAEQLMRILSLLKAHG